MKNAIALGLILIAALTGGCSRLWPVSEDRVTFVLAGAVTPRSVRINFKTLRPARVRVQVSPNPVTYANPLYSPYGQTQAGQNNVSHAVVDELHPGTQYYYRLVIDNTPSTSKAHAGKFTTPRAEPFSFKMAFASCAVTGSNSRIFQQIMQEKPLFYLNTGDLHYGNISSDCSDRFIKHYYRVFMSPRQSELYRSTPFVYMWDDHDYANNDSDRNAPCQQAAIAHYKQFMPYYPLAFDQPDDPVSQSFTVGRVRFILTDLRSQKQEPEYQDCQRVKTGSNFGSEAHLNWFTQQLLAAKEAGQLAVWVSGIPYINHPGGPNYQCDEQDDWGGFPQEREAIANLVKQHQIPLCILAGDAHMVAIDDGTNSDYASGGGAPVPVFHAGPLKRYGSFKGGPYSHGHRSKSGQYGVMEIEDNGGREICITWTAKNRQGNVVQNRAGKKITYRFCRMLGSTTP